MCLRWKGEYESDVDEAEGSNGGEATKGASKKKGKKKNKAQAKKKPTNKKKTNKDERQGGDAACEPPVPGDVAMALPEDDGQYKPGKFAEARRAYIKSYRQRHPEKSFREASEAWNLSGERSDYLATLPLKELQRRRFV